LDSPEVGTFPTVLDRGWTAVAVLGEPGLGLAAPGAVSAAPTLAILSVSPLQMRGAGFAARERAGSPSTSRDRRRRLW
jgi:hypothetical protein